MGGSGTSGARHLEWRSRRCESILDGGRGPHERVRQPGFDDRSGFADHFHPRTWSLLRRPARARNTSYTGASSHERVGIVRRSEPPVRSVGCSNMESAQTCVSEDFVLPSSHRACRARRTASSGTRSAAIAPRMSASWTTASPNAQRARRKFRDRVFESSERRHRVGPAAREPRRTCRSAWRAT